MHLHHWLHEDERIEWHTMANRGSENTRQVAGSLYVTNQRVLFEPHPLERLTQEAPWDAALEDVEVTISPGSWDTHIPVIRSMALRYHVVVHRRDGEEEEFFTPHVAEALQRLGHGARHS